MCCLAVLPLLDTVTSMDLKIPWPLCIPHSHQCTASQLTSNYLRTWWEPVFLFKNHWCRLKAPYITFSWWSCSGLWWTYGGGDVCYWSLKVWERTYKHEPNPMWLAGPLDCRISLDSLMFLSQGANTTFIPIPWSQAINKLDLTSLWGTSWLPFPFILIT